MLSLAFHELKRKQYQELLEPNSVGVVFAGAAKQSAGDEDYPFSPYRNFYYLTGYEKQGAIYLAYRDEKAVHEKLFIERPDPHRERYEGKMATVEDIKEKYGIADAGYLDSFERFVTYLFAYGDYQTLYADMEMMNLENRQEPVRMFVEKMKTVIPYLTVKNTYKALSVMRRVKETEEIEAHRKACAVTSEGVRYMMKHLKPGMMEYQAEAYFDFILKSNGCGHAFATIAASGENSCVLHYDANDKRMQDGELILFDLGASCEYYCADVSRTFPVNGRFTERQKTLYNIVLKGLETAISLSKPGQNKDELQEISKKVMAEELVKVGMIEKPEDINPYYLHGSGHFIGLYTHDVGENPSNVLVENTMFTLEPGLYFLDEKIGIRIEDTILVTKDGCEVLTADIPKTVDEIEAFMNK